MNEGLYIGLMSGTSMDGVDAALVRITDTSISLIGYHEEAYTSELKSALEAVVGTNTIDLETFGSLHIAVGKAFAAVTQALLKSLNITPEHIVAIGSHGQTLLHRPNLANPFSLQIGDPAVIAYQTGITTVADFRAKDLAAGGQGAPLVPAFHRFAFDRGYSEHAVLNIGGIANLTLFTSIGETLGFDTGPGNTLMDRWIQTHSGKSYDTDGAWARSGNVCPALLESLLSDQYFSLAGPKSSGRDYFNLEWLARYQDKTLGLPISPADIQATLAELTACSVTRSLKSALPHCKQLAICGGGVKNSYLLDRIRTQLSGIEIVSTEQLGIPASAVEACAFAWLAARRLSDEPGNLPSVTGAARSLVLGGIHHPN
jgi:anhydro-N-acetylmuramic acid kinase